MKFVLAATGIFYSDVKVKDKLEKLGFKFTEEDPEHKYDRPPMWRKDEGVHPSIEFNTLEELMEFQKRWGHLILWTIAHPNGRWEVGTKVLEIYNDYRE